METSGGYSKNVPPSSNSDGGGGASSFDGLMRTAIHNGLPNNNILTYFNEVLMGYPVYSDDQVYSPDVTGYSLIFIEPPHLSGYGLSTEELALDFSKISVFLAIDFTPPQTTVTVSEVSSTNGRLPYGYQVGASGSMQISFLDDSNLNAFGFHKTWCQYIDDISRGIVDPDDKYITIGSPEFGEIDYMASAYVARFKPTSELNWGDLVYIGKAVGLIPVTVPDKEVLGRRDSNELTMLPMSYQCTFYKQVVYGSPKDPNGWIYKEFLDKCQSLY